MSDFLGFKEQIQTAADKLGQTGLYKTNVNNDEFWELYLSSFPENTNPIYRERQTYDCSCCRQYLKNLGSVVTIIDNKMVSIWDEINLGNEFDVVAKALSDYVHSHKVKEPYFHYESRVGLDHNFETLEDGYQHRWDHFETNLLSQYVMNKANIPSSVGDLRGNRDVLNRSMETLSLEAAEIILELIEQNSLYRGEEHLCTIKSFIKTKKLYNKVNESNRENWSWVKAVELKGQGRYRNSVIGTLLVDLSEGVDLEIAVKKYEDKVAPYNYKRPKALITKRMIEKAQKKLAELNLEPSLSRRHSVAEDITINNVLYASRTAKKAMNVFDQLKNEVASDPKKFDKVEEVPVDKFLTDILPKANSLEVLVENKHTNNFMSLISPEHPEAKPIFKWGNNFSWAYNGDITDSIKERVKAAGGNVEGVLRNSLSWYNGDDLDIHVVEPGGHKIYYSNKNNYSTTGFLDIDMNAGGASNSKDPVENICWTNKSKMKEGIYELRVNNYSKRSSVNVGFECEIEDHLGQKFHFTYSDMLHDKKTVVVAKYKWSKESGVEIISSIPESNRSKDIWGVQTMNFVPVKMVMNSPNHWDGNSTGNRHTFFILEDCKNKDTPRGFFNEYLDPSLNEHRKVFEVLGNKMRVEESDEQLSGVGFSSTQRNDVLVKVVGNSERTIKVKF